MSVNVMTRAERRGLIALLIILALITAVIAFRSCGTDLPSAQPDDSDGIAVTDSLRALTTDTCGTVKQSRRRRKKPTAPKTLKEYPERNPLDEII